MTGTAATRPILSRGSRKTQTRVESNPGGLGLVPIGSTSVVKSGLWLLIVITAGVSGLPTNSGQDVFRELICVLLLTTSEMCARALGCGVAAKVSDIASIYRPGVKHYLAFRQQKEIHLACMQSRPA